MSPGDIKTSKQGEGKTVVLAIGIWAKRHKDGSIHIHMSGPDDSITTVTNNPKSKLRHHPNLFQKLRSTLIDQGCWPFGDEGAKMTESDIAPTEPRSRYNAPVVHKEFIAPRYQPIHTRGGESASEIVIHDRGRF
jgi:hypothetical protein